jgi:DNA polymerase-3 subunit gamma/tau
MAHQSLYRAYRPQAFKDVIGQDQVVRPLEEQIASGKVGHAYLFAGSRGLGKTSIARIFARELGTNERDIYEIDAASNNSVEDIRALTEQVYTLPFDSKFKVYILDEAHMLSKSAWNAFLKTLEEPPAYALFMLATTELDKVPETVQSRCQVFQLRKPGRQVLASLILDIGKKEKYEIDPSAADLIAMLGDGSYRDALSVLEKALASATDGKLSREDAERATGAPKHALVHALVTSLAAGDQNAALSTIRAVGNEGIDMHLYLTLVLEYLRQILLIRHAPELRNELAKELGDDVFAEASALASDSASRITHHTLKAFLDAASRIRFAPVPMLSLELAVMELSAG